MLINLSRESQPRDTNGVKNCERFAVLRKALSCRWSLWHPAFCATCHSGMWRDCEQTFRLKSKLTSLHLRRVDTACITFACFTIRVTNEFFFERDHALHSIEKRNEPDPNHLKRRFYLNPKSDQYGARNDIPSAAMPFGTCSGLTCYAQYW